MPTKIYDYDPFFERMNNKGVLTEIDDVDPSNDINNAATINEILELLRDVGIVLDGDKHKKAYLYDPFLKHCKLEEKLTEIDDVPTDGNADDGENSDAVIAILDLFREIGLVEE